MNNIIVEINIVTISALADDVIRAEIENAVFLNAQIRPYDEMADAGLIQAMTLMNPTSFGNLAYVAVHGQEPINIKSYNLLKRIFSLGPRMLESIALVGEPL